MTPLLRQQLQQMGLSPDQPPSPEQWQQFLAQTDQHYQQITTLSHELRTPLTGFLGITQHLLNSPLAPQQQNDTQLLYKTGQHMLALINQLLSHHTLPTAQQSFHLPDLLNEILQLCAPLGLPDLPRHLKLPPDLPPRLIGQPSQIRQILLNLLGNALKFTRQGEVGLHVEILASTPQQIHLRFTVWDTGIGIAEEALSRLFQAFTQADPTIKERFGGTGLGLAITRQLIEALQGSLNVQSQLGQGSRVSFVLPFEIPQSVPVRSLQGQILIAEDNPVNQRILAQTLDTLGYTYDIVDNGRDVLNALQLHAYAVVLMDCVMPDMDGYTTTRQLRQNGHRVPVLAMTAHTGPEAEAECRNAGMDAYLSKPVDHLQLDSYLRQWIRSHTILDPLALEQLRKLTGRSQEQITELADIFFQDTATRLQQLQQEILTQNLEKIGHIAHTLTSSTGYLGAVELHTLSRDLAHHAYQGDLAQSLVLSALLPDALERFKQAFTEENFGTCAP